MLQVLIYMSAIPGRAAELKSALLEFSNKRCQELGCKKCSLLQDAMIEENFILAEEWSVQDRLESNLNSDYIKDFFSIGAPLLARTPYLQWLHVVEP